MKTNYSSNCYDNASLGADLRIPESPELERAVLGALLLEPQYVADVRGILTSTAFYDPQNAAIYDVICKLDDRGMNIDLPIVMPEVRKAGISPEYLADLTAAVGSGVEILNHVRRLVEFDMRRRMFNAVAMSPAIPAFASHISRKVSIAGFLPRRLFFLVSILYSFIDYQVSYINHGICPHRIRLPRYGRFLRIISILGKLIPQRQVKYLFFHGWFMKISIFFAFWYSCSTRQ